MLGSCRYVAMVTDLESRGTSLCKHKNPSSPHLRASLTCFLTRVRASRRVQALFLIAVVLPPVGGVVGPVALLHSLFLPPSDLHCF